MSTLKGYFYLRSFSMRLMLAAVLALALGAGPLIAGCAGSTTNSTADRAGTTMAASSAPRADFTRRFHSPGRYWGVPQDVYDVPRHRLSMPSASKRAALRCRERSEAAPVSLARSDAGLPKSTIGRMSS